MKTSILMGLFFVGCGEKEETEASTEEKIESEETEETEEVFLPQEGEWLLSPLVVTENSCEFEDAGEEGEVAELRANEDGSYDFVLDEEMSFGCTVENMVLECESLSVEEANEGAVLTYTYSIEASFSSETEMAGSVQMEFNCDGEGCAAIEEMGMSLPCVLAGDFTAEAGVSESN